jgi:hypothetical protein
MAIVDEPFGAWIGRGVAMPPCCGSERAQRRSRAPRAGDAPNEITFAVFSCTCNFFGNSFVNRQANVGPLPEYRRQTTRRMSDPILVILKFFL